MKRAEFMREALDVALTNERAALALCILQVQESERAEPAYRAHVWLEMAQELHRLGGNELARAHDRQARGESPCAGDVEHAAFLAQLYRFALNEFRRAADATRPDVTARA